MTNTLLWDLAEMARQLGGVSERTVRRLIDVGAIARVRIGRRVLVRADSVKTHLDRASNGSDNRHRAGTDVREQSTCRIDARGDRFGGSVTPSRAASELDATSGTTDRREAAALKAKWKLESYRARQWEEQPAAGFEEVMLAVLPAHTQKRSADMDKLHARRLRASLAGAGMDRLSAKAVSHHVQRRRQDGVGPASINRELALLSAAINFWNLARDTNLPKSGARAQAARAGRSVAMDHSAGSRTFDRGGGRG